MKIAERPEFHVAYVTYVASSVSARTLALVIVREGNGLVVRLKVREDRVAQRYHYAAATSDPDARFARKTASQLDSAPVVRAPDLSDAASAPAGWRSTVYLTADRAVLERWTGSDFEYRSLPRSAALDAQLRSRYPGLEASR